MAKAYDCMVKAYGMNILAKLFCSKVRAEIVRLLFGLSREPLHLRDIQRKAGLALGTIQRDISHLEKLDLIVRRLDGNRVYFKANPVHPLTPDLRRLVLKTVGLADILRHALEGSGIRIAFVFGSIASATEHATSDVDLMIVGEIGLREVSRRLAGVSEQIGREVNPFILNASDFAKRRAAKEHFISSVLESPQIWIEGTENDLEAMGR